MLYTFGDSYAVSRTEIIPKRPSWAWPALLEKEYGIVEIACGQVASGLDYTFKKFDEYRDKFVKDDIVIIILTGRDRTNFFPDRPKLSVLSSFENINLVPKKITSGAYGEQFVEEEKQAMEMYYKWLHCDENIKTSVLNFLHNVQNATIQRHLKTIVFFTFNNDLIDSPLLSRFPNIEFARGNLWNTAMAEIAEESLHNTLREGMYTNDTRICHFSRINHKVLANKIIANINGRVPIDLSEGFFENVYTFDDYERDIPAFIDFFKNIKESKIVKQSTITTHKGHPRDWPKLF